MTLEFFIEQEDVVELQDFLLARSPSQQAAVRKGQVGGAAVIIAVALVVSALLRSWWPVALGPLLAAYAWAVAGRETRLRVRKRVREFLKESPAEQWEGTHQVSTTQDGIQVYSRSGSGTLAWSLLEHVERTDRHLFLCLGGVNGLVIPHTRLQSGDLEEFVRECQSRMRSPVA